MSACADQQEQEGNSEKCLTMRKEKKKKINMFYFSFSQEQNPSLVNLCEAENGGEAKRRACSTVFFYYYLFLSHLHCAV